VLSGGWRGAARGKPRLCSAARALAAAQLLSVAHWVPAALVRLGVVVRRHVSCIALLALHYVYRAGTKCSS
jgi:hypothetical protein